MTTGRKLRDLARTTAVAALVAALAGLLAALVRQPSIHRWPALVVYGAAWAVFAAALWLLRRVPLRAAVALILIGGAAVALAAASAPPSSSDDLYRYVWDGKVQAAGIDPYAHVPSAPQLAGLRDRFLWPADGTYCVPAGIADPDGSGTLRPGCTLINRPTVPTIYPPAAEAYFRAVQSVSPAGSRYKPIQLAAVVLGTAVTLVLLAGLRRLGRDPRQAAIWAWCPLVAYETGNGAHVDVLGVLFAVGALVVLALSRRAGGRAARWGAAAGGVLLALAVGAKFTPVFAAPAALRRRVLAVAAPAAATFALIYLPHVVAAGSKVVGFLPGYLNEQGYRSGTGFVLLGMVLPASWAPYAAVAVVGVTALLVYLRADPAEPWRGAVVLTGVALLVTTPEFPWYAMLLCAFVALDGRPEWLAVPVAGLAAQHVSYALAAGVVIAGWWLRRRSERQPERPAVAGPSREVGAGAGSGLGPALGLALGPALGSALGSVLGSDSEPASPGQRSSDPPVLADVILPCLDEAAALPGVLAGLPAGYRPIVVDNGSSDGSAALAARLGATVVTEPRRGFGAACHAGLLAATAPIVCFCDCDGSFDTGQLPMVAEPVAHGAADLVLGRRRPLTAGAWPPHARIANAALAFRMRRAGVAVHDLGPMRAARRDALLALDLADRRSGYPLEMVLKAAAADWRIVETDVEYAPRTGKSKVTGTVSGTVKAVRDMSRVWREVTQETAR